MKKASRFDELQQLQGDCLVWLGSHDERGRPRYGKKKHLASRVAWERANGTIPVGMALINECGNKECVNADHHHLGTQKEVQANKEGHSRHNATIYRQLPAWLSEAACLDADPVVFFYGDGNSEPWQAALSICANCPVRKQCAEWTDDTGFSSGVAGGKVYG